MGTTLHRPRYGMDSISSPIYQLGEEFGDKL
jgi:hypothetical protein